VESFPGVAGFSPYTTQHSFLLQLGLTLYHPTYLNYPTSGDNKGIAV